MRPEPNENIKYKTSAPSLPSRERSFDLSLSAAIKGSDARGTEFEEKTSLITISSQKAEFTLKSPVLIGSRVQLVLSVPRTLILGKRLFLHISGEVVYMESSRNGRSHHRIAVQLDKPFKIESPS